MKIASKWNDLEVTVVKVGNDTYFNDAKVVTPNIITSNGVIHILDRIMSFDGEAPGEKAPEGARTGSPSSRKTSEPNAGVRLTRDAGASFMAFSTVALLLWFGY